MVLIFDIVSTESNAFVITVLQLFGAGSTGHQLLPATQFYEISIFSGVTANKSLLEGGTLCEQIRNSLVSILNKNIRGNVTLKRKLGE